MMKPEEELRSFSDDIFFRGFPTLYAFKYILYQPNISIVAFMVTTGNPSCCGKKHLPFPPSHVSRPDHSLPCVLVPPCWACQFPEDIPMEDEKVRRLQGWGYNKQPRFILINLTYQHDRHWEKIYTLLKTNEHVSLFKGAIHLPNHQFSVLTSRNLPTFQLGWGRSRCEFVGSFSRKIAWWLTECTALGISLVRNLWNKWAQNGDINHRHKPLTKKWQSYISTMVTRQLLLWNDFQHGKKYHIESPYRVQKRWHCQQKKW